MKFVPLAIAGAFRIELEKREDERGFFARLFCAEEFAAHGLATRFVQCNTSLTRAAGTLRGLHFQRPPKAEAKLIRCLRGAAYDVMLDLRQGSETYGSWTSVDLTEDNRSMVYIPEGCAHGFQTRAPDTELLYFHSEVYAPQAEGGVLPTDPGLAIRWPLPVAGLSPRDEALPKFSDVEPVT